MAFDLTPSAQFKTGITYFITNESVYKRQQDEYRYHVMGGRRFPAHNLNIGFPELEPLIPEFEPRIPGFCSVQVRLRPDDDGEGPVLAHHPQLEVVL